MRKGAIYGRSGEGVFPALFLSLSPCVGRWIISRRRGNGLPSCERNLFCTRQRSVRDTGLKISCVWGSFSVVELSSGGCAVWTSSVQFHPSPCEVACFLSVVSDLSGFRFGRSARAKSRGEGYLGRTLRCVNDISLLVPFLFERPYCIRACGCSSE